MKFFSIATVALFDVISASIHITDEGQIFSNGARRPILNSNFRMSCLADSVYDEKKIVDFSAKAYQKLAQSVSSLKNAPLTHFPTNRFTLIILDTIRCEEWVRTSHSSLEHPAR
ncbi:BgTH12-06758 [Blumeria graminis f. sp. triticale]|uniref:BgTH12-06758 n=1 Tax=Blumeria graminis f. sp. triticale TaxID=1689686 RepID=A0A9W4CYS0_BLUGR|nr:BgTH12-06758 [Blumeria graminis f. sp. triticale]